MNLAANMVYPVPSLSRPIPIDDVALVRGLVEGQAAAASAVWDRYATFARALLRRIVGPGGDLEDLVQEVFLQVFRDVKRIRDAQALRAFIMQICTHVAISELRKRTVRRWLRLTDDGAMPEYGVDARADSEDRLAVKALYRILEGLSADSRTAFALHYVEGLDLASVASTMNISLATAKRRLAHAREKVELRAKGDPALSSFLAGDR